jgi:hypothetical protein
LFYEKSKMQHARISHLKGQLTPFKEAIVNHPLYASMQTIDDLRIFMQHHIFAVWDFMSLLKELQRRLTCTHVPWQVTGSPETRYLINEIVTGEESDLGPDGRRSSHFELYLSAMAQCGADASSIQWLTKQSTSISSLYEALKNPAIPIGASAFVHHTFQTIEEGNTPSIAAAFAFGREDLVPDMFLSLVRDLNQREQNQMDRFIYYLERHIELDGDEHSHLAEQMVIELCGEDESNWLAAEKAAMDAFIARKNLWDAIHTAIQNQRL